MARRRYISTEISIDKKVNKLATEYGDFAALLYTWMIPHAEDNCEITGDPEEISLTVCPGRRDKTEEDIIKAIEGMTKLKLIFPFVRDEKPMLFFPPDNFYKYQTYISRGNRNYSGVEGREKKQNAEERRETPETTVSPSPSLSHSLNSSSCSSEREAKVFQFFNQNINPIGPYQSQVISQYLDDGIEPEMILAIMQDSIGKRDKWSWIQRVLNNSISTGIKTLAQYEFAKKEREESKSRDKPKKNKTEEKEDKYKKAQEEAERILREEGVLTDD